MGDVVELRPRRGVPVGGETGDPSPPLPEEPAGDSADDGTETVVVSATPAPPPRLQRPGWLGVRKDHRQALRAGVAHGAKRTAARTAFELFRGMPRRAGRCVRWFVRGVIGHRDSAGTWTGGWVGLLGWCFAARERADALQAAADNPGSQIRATQHADRIAWWHSLILVIPHVAGGLALNHYTPLPWFLVLAPFLVGTTIYGHHIDPKPPAPIASPRTREHVGIESMNAALRAIGILDKPTTQNPEPDGVRLASVPRTIGGGQESCWDLPAACGKEARDVLAQRGRLAGAFSTPYDQFIVDLGNHPAQFVIWQAPRDPFAGQPEDHPLLDQPRWDVWKPVPFGKDARGRTVSMSLVFTSLLVGARPRRGKSFAARSVVAGAVLDPNVRFHVADGKGGGTWAALKPLSQDFVEGADDHDVNTVADMLRVLVADMRARHRRIPGSKITPDTATDPQVDAPITFVIVDEVQEYFESHRGVEIASHLTKLAKVGPSAGYCLVLITQRPDSDTFPSALRAVMGARFALEVMSYHDSNVILGPNMSKLGHDASLITHRGVGLLRPDDDANGEPDDDRSVRAVRTFDTDDEPWQALCNLGADLRRINPDPPVGGGEEPAKGLLALVVDVLREHGDMPASGLLGHLPEPWSSMHPRDLGTELKDRGLSSHATHHGRRYRASDAVAAMSQRRRDDVAPRSAATTSGISRDDSATSPRQDHDATRDEPDQPKQPTGTTDSEI